MARTQYFSAPTEWKTAINIEEQQATIQAGYDARMAILNGAEWDDYPTPEGINESLYLAGWNLAEIHFSNPPPL